MAARKATVRKGQKKSGLRSKRRKVSDVMEEAETFINTWILLKEVLPQLVRSPEHLDIFTLQALVKNEGAIRALLKKMESNMGKCRDQLGQLTREFPGVMPKL